MWFIISGAQLCVVRLSVTNLQNVDLRKFCWSWETFQLQFGQLITNFNCNTRTDGYQTHHTAVNKTTTRFTKILQSAVNFFLLKQQLNTLHWLWILVPIWRIISYQYDFFEFWHQNSVINFGINLPYDILPGKSAQFAAEVASEAFQIQFSINIFIIASKRVAWGCS